MRQSEYKVVIDNSYDLGFEVHVARRPLHEPHSCSFDHKLDATEFIVNVWSSLAAAMGSVAHVLTATDPTARM
ncbi:hypothetical protein SPRG_17041 [Saprolegnia parasitica CBS 223.65]|uniref:Uncharacterized protein n=1 Tax=Saprolegnia parasitica (strain CBS 223.65) TaxID=695850 RepID=A0A067BL88_SAPPC|nr:hypothetical protein SPRG_17041 [Saprolegnia parasitica CBS 223.65]KDO17500.1 hypothetical protein SPRG_17041 [Saprolegnia parasitica CBS 223.65]|eukprot:XP_012211795.1 hypothetical protein SPRG_17041 [Saprolegnia parasitica CBS 223.65]